MEFKAHQITTHDFLKTTLPKSLEHPSFDHRYHPISGQDIVLAKGDLHKIENEGGMDYNVMCIQLVTKAHLEDGTIWDLTAVMTKAKTAVEALVGYPYMMDIELTENVLDPVQAAVQKGGRVGGGSNDAKGKHGKTKGKGKGKGGETGKKK